MKNLTQVEMATFLKISKSSLCDIEKGRQQVSLELASKIAKKCGLSEVVAIEAALKDLVYRSGLKLDVEVKRAA
jgi:DNA-binding XRE family transcriptional regulator